MGGSIGIVIRERSGKVHKMVGWTNPLPNFVKNIKFFKSDEEHIQKYIDYLLQEHNVDEELIGPVDYGIVVFDFKEKKLYSSQNYCDFSKFHIIEPGKAYLNGDYGDITEFAKNDILIHPNGFKGNNGNLSKPEDYLGLNSHLIKIDLDKLGWKLIENDAHREENLIIFKSMVNDGFEFTTKDIQLWEDTLISKWKDYEEYGEDSEEPPLEKGTYFKHIRNYKIDKII